MTLSIGAGLVLPAHYPDDNPHTGLGQFCEYSGTGDMATGCPRGCTSAREHYSNDGNPQCEDGIGPDNDQDTESEASWR